MSFKNPTYLSCVQMLYCEKIRIKINQNASSNLMLAVEGKGSEPEVEFSHHLLEFPSIMPFSDSSEAELTISNPKNYPVEIYSLEFDKQYLEDEEVGDIVCNLAGIVRNLYYDTHFVFGVPDVEVG